jgi:hypothetical protein
MRFEYQCLCGADMATEDNVETDEEIKKLETTHDTLVHSHIRNCKIAKRNFVLSDVNANGN